MTVLSHLRRALLRPPPSTTIKPSPTWSHHIHTATSDTQDNNKNKKDKWLTLPEFRLTVNGTTLGKNIAGWRELNGDGDGDVTAIKWVMKCCPELPRSLVQKLFRLRQVRRKTSEDFKSDQGVQATENQVKRDSAIIVINKPPGMPVQGGIGIKRSLDELAGIYLRHDSSESPRLMSSVPTYRTVHRLDRDSSGILVLGRSQLSATVLHSVFREKTFGATNIDLKSERRFLQRKYWALVIGSPRRPQGLISVPLGKVVMDDGRSERITVVENVSTMLSQHAITEYRVLDSSIHGLTWLELSPLTGRKHQIRVHCAEVLGTPIVGDYKYGWQSHKKWNQITPSDLEVRVEVSNKKSLPFGLDLDSGSVTDKQPNLHLHCKKMVLPDVSSALKQAHISSDYDFGDIKSLKFEAPLPPHMQRSWDILCT